MHMIQRGRKLLVSLVILKGFVIVKMEKRGQGLMMVAVPVG